VRMHVIGDEDTVVGFRFAGVDGTVAEDEEAAASALNDCVEGGDAIVIVTERVGDWLRRPIDRLRYGADLPLVVEVPGRDGPLDEAGSSLLRLIREAVGIRV